MLERKFRENAIVTDKFRKMTATGSLSINDQVVHCDTTLGNITVTLPNVSEAAGLAYSITHTVDGGYAVTIQDNDESYRWSDLTLADVYDRYLLWSDGFQWWILSSVGI